MQNGWTALEQAAFSGHHNVVELLVGAGANPDLQNKVKKTDLLSMLKMVGFNLSNYVQGSYFNCT